MFINEIGKGESSSIEFKIQIPDKGIKYVKTVVAFSNGSGGKIIIGIDDKTREVVGVSEEDVFELMDGIANTISDSCTPLIVPNIYFTSLEHKTLIVIEIYPGASRPYYITSLGKEKGTFVRIAGTTRPADPVILRELELEGEKLSYDSLPAIGYKVKEDAVKKLCKDIKSYIIDSTVTEEEKEKVRDVTKQSLINWGVLKQSGEDIIATHAFVILTDQADTMDFAKIQCARFKGTTRENFTDKKEYIGPVYEQIEKAYSFVLNHINMNIEIEGIIRKERYELPPDAIRECIINAATHRNYMMNSCVQVAVYDDRVEITSPGMLFGNLDLEMIKKGNSQIRNKILAKILNKMRIVEEWGSGIGRIIGGCKSYNLKEPTFEEIGDCFRVNLYRNGDLLNNKIEQESNQENQECNQESQESNQESQESNQESQESNQENQETSQESQESNQESQESNQENQESNQESQESNQENQETSQESQESNQENQETSQESNQEISQKMNLNSAQKAIIAMIRDNEKVTQNVMSVQLGLSSSTIKKNVNVLRENGIIFREGSTKAGKWIVNI